MSELRNFFDRVCCISLRRRPERWNRFQQGIPGDWPFREVERIAAMDGAAVPAPDWWRPTAGAWGCFRSHLSLIEHAINDGLTSILLLEDDALFSAEFTNRVTRFLNQVPDDWGMLYLGGQHLRSEHVSPKPVNNEVCIPHNVNRTHAFALRGETMKAVYRHLTSVRWQPGHHIDHHLGRFVERRDRRFPVYCPTEWLVGQHSGTSDITPRRFPDRFWQDAPDRPADQAEFVAVVGLHSSGSSALAGVLWALGVDLGNDLGGYYGDAPGMKCGYEDRDLTEICETLIPFPSVEINEAPELVARLRWWISRRRKRAGGKTRLAGGKYPMLCRLGPQILNVCGQKLKLIISDRDPRQSIRSLQRRCPDIDPEVVAGHQQWLWEGLQELKARVPDKHQLTVKYDDLLRAPEEQAGRLARFLKLESPDLPCRIARAAVPIHIYAGEQLSGRPS